MLRCECLGLDDQQNGSVSVGPLMVLLVLVKLCSVKCFGSGVEAEICWALLPLVWEDGRCSLCQRCTQEISVLFDACRWDTLGCL